MVNHTTMAQHNIQPPADLQIFPSGEINTLRQIQHIDICAGNDQFMKTTYQVIVEPIEGNTRPWSAKDECYTVCPMDAVNKAFSNPKYAGRKILRIVREPFLSFI